MIKTIVVEDEELIRKGMLYTIEWEKYGCVIVGEAKNGLEGEELILSSKPDLVIIDIKMPFQDGLKTIEKTKPLVNFEAVILSGYGEFAYAKQAITLGVFDYLLKPIEDTVLYEVLEKVTMKIETHRNKAVINNCIHNDKGLWSIIENQNLNLSPTKKKQVTIILSKIEKNYARNLTLGEISWELNVSESYLGRVFKEITGHTFGEYLTRFRMTKAVEFLSMTQYRVNEVAEIVGVSDSRYFSTVFKKYIGCTPSEIKNGYLSKK